MKIWKSEIVNRTISRWTMAAFVRVETARWQHAVKASGATVN
jgi:hypothetical protein